MSNQNVINAPMERELMRLVRSYIDNGAPARVIAAECNINWSLFQHYLDGTSNKRMLVKTAKNLVDWINAHDEHMPKDIKRCSKCGRVKPISAFYKNTSKKDGHQAWCKTCTKEHIKKAITAEIVNKVKAEDNPDVSSAMLAPYFGITPKQFDAIRNGEWDSILYKKEPPKPATDVKNAVEALRVEIADMHSLLNRLMAEMCVTVTK